MGSRKLAIASLLVLAGTPSERANAQQSAPRFCNAAFQALASQASLPAPAPPDPTIVFRNCAPGDSVVIPNGAAVLAAQVCDFSKAIFVVPGALPSIGTTITCIVATPTTEPRPSTIGPVQIIR
jgi:hypothetical protein